MNIIWQYMSPATLIQIGFMFGMWVIGFVAGLISGHMTEKHKWQDEMIRRNYASYNWRNGNWQWGLVPPGKEVDGRP